MWRIPLTILINNDPMGDLNKFDNAIMFYEEVLSQLPSYRERLSSQEHAKNKTVARKVFEKVASKCEIFLDIVRGESRHNYINFEPICFPRRFLNISSTSQLSNDLKISAEEMLSNIFYLGLAYHLLFMTFPTRANIDKVDLNVLFEKWLPNALVADIQLRPYAKQASDYPNIFFNCYYEKNNIEQYLKKKFKVGYFKRGKCRSNLKNLFFCGALLGLMCDLETK